MSLGIREALENAATSLESTETSDGASETPANTGVAPTEGESQSAGGNENANNDSAGAKAESVGGGGVVRETSSTQGRARDATGKFIKAAQTPEQKEVEVDKTQAASPAAAQSTTSSSPVAGGDSSTKAPAPPVVTEKAPSGWTPAAKEKWAALPPEVRKEVDRREKETAVALKESHSARELATRFNQTVAPFMGMIQAEGADAMGAVRGLLQTAMALRTSPPAHKAMLVAKLVRDFGVPIEALDSALAGQPPSDNGAQQSAFRDPRFDQFLATLQQSQTQRQQSVAAQHQKEIEAFAETHEFFPNVRPRMAALADAYEQEGKKPSLDELYEEACYANKEVRAILLQREAAERAKAEQASTQRARTASVSVKGQPAPVSPTKPKDIREQLAEAAARVEGRR